ncbi:MAG: type II toxin-antitoxin system VapC family toxin [Candidatus Kapabacteria bacterium]|jgi:predicted nucleic acid-binding protein|nr:type II toxin-antitoxin system VapC family toxin [Candidatus Kapabacteria bacterium]
MTLYYLDSTAWLQYYVREAGSDKVAALFTPSTVLACSSFGFVEVVVTLSRLAYSGKISKEDLSHKIHDLENDWTQFLQVHSSHRVIKLTEAVALKHNLSPERALHLAAAIAVHEHSQNSGADTITNFASTDTELLTLATQYELIAINIST